MEYLPYSLVSTPIQTLSYNIIKKEKKKSREAIIRSSNLGKQDNYYLTLHLHSTAVDNLTSCHNILVINSNK